MHTFKKSLGSVLAAALAVMGVAAYAAPATAQTYNSGNSGVARVSLANGGVVIVRGDSGAQVAATINAPLVPGDYIATGSGADSEVQFDGISMLRLAQNTQVRVVNLSPGSREVQLAAGTVDLAELQGADGSPQVDTPSLSVRPNQTGDYRVTVLGNAETLVTVRSGAATISTAYGSRTLTPGSTLVANGSSITTQGAVGFDSFDQFNISRDQAMVSSYNSNPYVSPQLAGYSNFANYGQWQNVPGYGYAWAPNNQNQTNFAPYQNGQWTWEPGYGYTWVDNAPYGYATSHYGTWFNNSNYGGWLWQPPANQYQNSSASLSSAWLPAVVTFFLSGNNGSSLGDLGNLLGGFSGLLGNSGNADIGWIPLAPGEQYQPWYGQNNSYPPTGLSNVTNVTNIYNSYGNARYYRGITMVPVSAWRSGNFRRLIVVRPQQVQRMVLVRGAVPLVPTTSNLHYSSVRAVRRPVVLSRTFAAPRLAAKAPAETRLSFKTQQARIRSIAIARPKVVVLHARPVKAAHPVYHPIAHAPVHPVVIKPVAHRTAHSAPSVAKPVTQRAAPVAKPATHRAAPAARPVALPAPAAKPVRYQAAPVVKPAPKRAAPLVKPVMHPAPAAKPVRYHAAPVVKPAPPRAAPVVRPVVRPAPRPEGKPEERPRPKPSSPAAG